MKAKLLNNLGLKILSLLLAMMLWVVVTTVEDPNKTRKIPSVKVEIQNEDVVLKQGKVYEVLSGSEVDIILEGRRSNVMSVDKSDFKVTADLSELTPPYESVSIKVECPKYDYLPSSQFSYHLGKVNVMKIAMEDKETKKFPIKVEVTGTPEEGYALGEKKASPRIVEVSGAKTLVDKIAEVKANVNIDGLSENMRIKEALTAYDENGKALDSEKLSFSIEKVNISIELLRTKTIPVYIKTEGEAAEGFGVSGLEYEPKEILVAGRDEDLKEMVSLPITLDITGRSSKWETEVTLADYLPANIILADSNTAIAVEVMIEPFEKRDFLLSYIDIAFKNTPEEYRISYQNVTNTNMNVQIMGERGAVESLTVDQLNAYVDLQGLEEGSHTLPVQFQLPSGVTVISAPSITLELIKRGETPETETPTQMPSQEPEVMESPVPTASPFKETENPEPTAQPGEEPTASEDDNP